MDKINTNKITKELVEQIIYDWVAEHFDLGEAADPSWNIEMLAQCVADKLNKPTYTPIHTVLYADEEDFEPSTWILAWEVASWIKPTLWTTLVTKHSSGLWTKFLIPRAIVDNNEIKIVRWLNYYYTKKKGE